MRVNGLPLCVQAHAGGASASVGQKYPAGGYFPPPLQRAVRGDGHCNIMSKTYRAAFRWLQRAARGDGHCNFTYNGKRQKAETYEPDFVYMEDGRMVAEDVKGQRLPLYRIKSKLFMLKFPHIEFREIPAKDVA